MKDSYSEMEDKMDQINTMIADLQSKAEGQKSERQKFEEENGITDGPERLQAAMAEARARHAKRDEAADTIPDTTDEAQKTEDNPSQTKKDTLPTTETIAEVIIEPTTETTPEETITEETTPPIETSTHSDEL